MYRYTGISVCSTHCRRRPYIIQFPPPLTVCIPIRRSGDLATGIILPRLLPSIRMRPHLLQKRFLGLDDFDGYVLGSLLVVRLNNL